MTHLRVHEAAELLGVSDDTVRRWVEAGRLDAAKEPGSPARLDGVQVARLAREHAAAPPAGPAASASARNRFRGIVTAVTADTVMAQVELQAGPYRVVSLLSREAVDELGLEPGVIAIASVKATNVGIEVPS